MPAHVFALVGGVWWEPFGGVFGGFLGVGFPVGGLEVDGVVGEIASAVRIPLVGARIPGVAKGHHVVDGDQVAGFSSAFEVNGGVGVGVVEFPLGHDAVAFGGFEFHVGEVAGQNVVAGVATVVAAVHGDVVAPGFTEFIAVVFGDVGAETAGGEAAEGGAGGIDVDCGERRCRLAGGVTGIAGVSVVGEFVFFSVAAGPIVDRRLLAACGG